jgi:hypothetical protein
MASEELDVCETYRRVIDALSMQINNRVISKRRLVAYAIQFGMLPEDIVDLAEERISVVQGKRKLLRFLRTRGLACYDNPQANEDIRRFLLSYTGHLVSPRVRKALVGLIGLGMGEEAIRKVVQELFEKGGKKTIPDAKILTTKKAMRDWVSRVLRLYQSFLRKTLPDMDEAQASQLSDTMREIVISDTDDVMNIPAVRLMLSNMGLMDGGGAISGSGFSIGSNPKQARMQFLALVDELSDLNRHFMSRVRNSIGEKDAVLFYKLVRPQLVELRESITKNFKKKCIPYWRQQQKNGVGNAKKYDDVVQSMNEGEGSYCQKVMNDAKIVEDLISQLDAELQRRAAKHPEVARVREELERARPRITDIATGAPAF